MRATKKDIVKVILQVLYNKKEIPEEKSIWEKRINTLMKNKKEKLEWYYELAMGILQAKTIKIDKQKREKELKRGTND